MAVCEVPLRGVGLSVAVGIGKEKGFGIDVFRFLMSLFLSLRLSFPLLHVYSLLHMGENSAPCNDGGS